MERTTISANEPFSRQLGTNLPMSNGFVRFSRLRLPARALHGSEPLRIRGGRLPLRVVVPPLLIDEAAELRHRPLRG